MGKTVITYIQIYDPTATAEEKKVEKFYLTIENILKDRELERKNLILIGDWNSQIGQRQKGEKNIMWEYVMKNVIREVCA